jgi:hypothetical protein
MVRKRTFAAMAPYLALLLLTAATWAQVAGRLSGTVTDQTGSVVPGATVSLSLEGGESALTKATTNESGIFLFSGLQPVSYTLTVETSGFSKYVVRAVKVNPGQETALGQIALEVGTVAESVEVSAESIQVQTANAEIATNITNSQIMRLPQLNRSPLALLTSQAGVNFSGRESTTINGLRSTYNNVTIDGVNIQDNFIRTNALDFLPNLLLSDQIAEVTVSTSNSSTNAGGGASQVAFVTPSGTNRYKGNLYWFNRNNIVAANGFFSNRDGIRRPFLNQNQVGGSLGGPIVKDKLFFYGNYEAFRLRQQSAANRTILTDDARQGIFTYRTTGGEVRKVNLLTLSGRSADPFMAQLISQLPAGSQINNFRNGDSSETLLRNTGGFSYNIRNNRTRDNITGKVDYYINEKHSVAGTILWNRDIVDRTDLTNNFDLAPPVANDGATKLFSAAWRWNPTPTITNELRGGFNLTPALFLTYNERPEIFTTGLIFSNPQNTFLDQGRFTDTFNLSNTMNWVKEKHNFQIGYQGQYMRTNPFNDAGIIPSYGLGISANQVGLQASQLPGISAADLTIANNMLSNLAGILSTSVQTFNVTSRDSGFVAGANDNRNYEFDMHGFYFQDNWRMTNNFTLNMGVRYDYFTVPNERDSLALMPVVQGDLLSTIYSNYTLDFAGKSVGRPFYNADRNNFAPNLGFAWDPFGKGDFVLRGGYSVNFVNDNHIQSIRNSVNTNAGLSQSVNRVGLTGTVSNGRQPLPTPTFKVPRTAADNYAASVTQALGIPNPDTVAPYVQQWNFSIQKRVMGGVFEARYVGNKLTKGFRAFDYNQLNINEQGFLADFNRARSNGFLAQAATGSFNPAFNANIAGSQPLTVFPRLASGGLLTNATIRNLIQTGQPGELASVYQTNRLNGQLNFFPNPLALATNIVENFSNANYNGLQLDFRRAYTNGLQFQLNYAFSKAISDTAGDEQTSFQAFVDFNNTGLEKARSIFDTTHSTKANFAYTLPFGEGGKWSTTNAFINKVIGGWSVNGLMTYQSGAPFSIMSLRGTVNRGVRSNNTQNGNPASTTLTKSQIDDLIAFRMTGNGPFYFAPSVTGNDGRAAQPDGQPLRSGQAFYNPNPGENGGLARRMFDGPMWFNFDMGIMKTTQITERQSIEFRAEAINAFQNTTWYVGDQDINSVNFGRITGTVTTPRRMQFGLYYRF